jgi:serine/threonine protein kinase
MQSRERALTSQGMYKRTAMSTSLPSGGRIGAYRIERLLGRGGMSTVYLAEDTGLKRMVALKVLAPETADDERFRERFIRESQLAASLDDPNVLPVYDAGEHGGVLFIAMRYVEGTDLRTVIRDEGALDLARTERIIDQVATALDAAHAKGLIHRDVKPGNILLTRASDSRAEHAYLADFGLSKRTTSESSLTGTGVFAGTMRYAAPEQFEGRPLDVRTDVYSLGCVAFECLTGEPPFAADQDATLMYAHLMATPPTPTAIRPELPPGVDPVIAKALAKRPGDRYARAGDLAAALDTAIGRSAWPEAQPPRKTGIWLAIAAALLLGIAGVIVALTRGDGTPAGDRPSPTAQADALPPGSLAMIDPETGEPSRVLHDISALGAGVAGSAFRPILAIGEGAAWLYSLPRGFVAFLSHLDENTGQLVDRVPVRIIPGAGPALAVGSRTVWYSGEQPGETVSRINPATDDPLEPVQVNALVTDVVLTDDALWVGSSDGIVTAFDALTGKFREDVDVDGTPDALAYGSGSLWAIDTLANEVIRVDPKTRSVVARIPVAGNLKDIAAGDGGVWLLDDVSGTATPIDPATDSAGAPVRLGPDPSAIAVGFGAAWVTDAQDGDLYRIDPELQRATPIPFGTPLVTVAIDDAGRSVWVGTQPVD